jgi:FAD synthase
MRIIRDLNEIAAPLPNAVVTIGNFDGVHLGHREIFRRLVGKARELGGVSVATLCRIRSRYWHELPRLITPMQRRSGLSKPPASTYDLSPVYPRDGDAFADRFVEKSW